MRQRSRQGQRGKGNRSGKPREKPTDRTQEQAASVDQRAAADQHNGRQTERAPTEPPPRWRRIWFFHEDRLVRLTGWVAAFTGLLSIVTFVQCYSFIISESPFLSIASIKFPDHAP